ncbi:MAG: hypothetical protein M3O30_00995 [Planctomycetota bacterium]|nr:hypothetical protein [Planctomycetota bacterium]
MRPAGLPIVALCIICSLVGAGATNPSRAADAAQAGGFAGKYQATGLTVEIVAGDAGGYSGSIHMGDKQFPLVARLVDGKLQGQFSSQGTDFSFTATLDGQELTLVTGGATHVLKRDVPPVNPLGAQNPLAPGNAPGPANPLSPGATDHLAQSAGGANSLDGYSVLASSDAGRALFTQKTDTKSAHAAMQATLHELGNYFDAKPTVTGAFADDADQRGGASFTGQLKGKAVKGSIICGIGEKGAAVSVVYYNADAAAADVSSLMGAVPVQTKWVEHQLSGGSGIVKTPEDWKLVSSSNIGAAVVTGPAGQTIRLGDGAEVLAPNNWLVPGQAQMPMAQRMLVAPFTGPEEALKNLIPEINLISQAQGGPAMQLEKIIKTAPIAAQLPNGRAEAIYYAIAMGKPENMIHYRALCQLECYPISNDTWAYYFVGASAPDATYDRDVPIMLDIAKSWKLNDNAVAQNSQANVAAQNQRFAAFEQTMKEKNDSFDRYLQSVQNNEVIQEKSNADFDEVIRGYRTVEDTETGNRTQVDLGNVHDIVNQMNQNAGSERYKEIPLRDQ